MMAQSCYLKWPGKRRKGTSYPLAAAGVSGRKKMWKGKLPATSVEWRLTAAMQVAGDDDADGDGDRRRHRYVLLFFPSAFSVLSILFFFLPG